MTENDDEAKRIAYQAVQEVTSQIEKFIAQHGYEPSDELKRGMPGEYLPGFIVALTGDLGFWNKKRTKVLRMAGYVAAISCFLVERNLRFLSALDENLPEVDVGHWRMAMGIVRSACLVEDPRYLGIPCNRTNFPIQAEEKADIVMALAGIIAKLMTDD